MCFNYRHRKKLLKTNVFWCRWTSRSGRKNFYSLYRGLVFCGVWYVLVVYNWSSDLFIKDWIYVRDLINQGDNLSRHPLRTKVMSCRPWLVRITFGRNKKLNPPCYTWHTGSWETVGMETIGQSSVRRDELESLPFLLVPAKIFQLWTWLWDLYSFFLDLYTWILCSFEKFLN